VFGKIRNALLSGVALKSLISDGWMKSFRLFGPFANPNSAASVLRLRR